MSPVSAIPGLELFRFLHGSEPTGRNGASPGTPFANSKTRGCDESAGYSHEDESVENRKVV